MGFIKKEIRLQAATEFKSELPPIALWRLSGKTLPLRWSALASEIRIFLESKPTVMDRNTGLKRPLVPGDISVLAPTNDWCMAISEAIRAVGIDASFSSGSLMAQPEVILALAAYRCAIDENDRLAAGEIAVLMGADPDTWLEQALSKSAPGNWSKTLERLTGLRNRCVEFTPVELLDEVIAVASIESFVERLEKGADRLANLAALRGLAVTYEDRCSQLLAPCTAIGFLSHVSDLAEREEEPVPGWSRPSAIDVGTLHKSKGLEWPIVIVVGLDKKFDRDGSLFGARVIGRSAKDFSAENPLEGRGVRYMPWPFGKKGVDAVDQRLSTDEEVQLLTAGAAAELRRLLYVALTRPREMLVLAVSDTATVAPGTYVGTLCDENGIPLLTLPDANGTEISLGAQKFPCEVKAGAAREFENEKVSRCVLPSLERAGEKMPLLQVASSTLELSPDSGIEITIGEVIELGGKLILSGPAEDEMVGNAIHAFLGADDVAAESNGRHALAREIIDRWRLVGAILEADLVAASDRLAQAIATRWPKSSVDREIPMSIKVKNGIGETYVRGILDLVARNGDEIAIIDHKTTNISQAAALVRAKVHCPQLATYAVAVSESSKSKAVTCWLHYPMGGFLVEVRIENPLLVIAESLGAATHLDARNGVE